MSTQYHYLYVEDDALSREVLQTIMSLAIGITTLTVFEDGTDFMARLKALPAKPDVVLLDIHISPHNGFELLQMLRADPGYRNVKVIALTASVMNEEVKRLRNSGFDGAIAKPLSVTTFPDLLKRIANGESVWHIA
ncbi:MAG: response regulator [Aggregatilineales bacterium]